ncbi:MAG: TlyA family RNA methyltransferase [Alphaproteobacteria bacterium]|nr:TlyA family RNA methyltransferase [Alphaproteobacteria bacterium]MDE2014345.1 TlyA family RNA methyltransferase [Alphaproteobacteria bacterium]MDE2073655.1 TlyA family RNA methyltransferase [Alphaproteobacteria bacterium]MDE2352045.1 TlyA family RNA methyltransferase [Alphaproteobacteria bacterium]
MNAPPKRADVFLVEHGHAASRAEAQAAIKAGRVTADGAVVTKPAQRLHDGMAIAFEKEHPYVSRGALKLIAALDHFGFSPEGRACLDLGASTGGFSEVLLERGARHVTAVDVGHAQLHEKVSGDPRVTSYEGVNARELTAEIAGVPEAIVIDVSFISLMLALPRALALAAPGAWLVALVKPQFEVGRGHVGKGGLVRDAGAAHAAAERVAMWLSSVGGWTVHGLIESPVAGGDGSREYLLGAVKA